MAFLEAGCAGHAPDSTSGAAPAAGAAAPTDSTSPKATVMPRKIIYSADVEIVADDLQAAGQSIAKDAATHGGFLADYAINGTPGTRRTGTWTVRVPATQFEAFLAELGTVGDLNNTKITSQDVSEEYYDVDARIRNKQVEEARLVEHLKGSTAQLSDILTVERELSRVREEIERLQGRLRFLANQTDLSTITITVRERGDDMFGRPQPFTNRMARTLLDSLQVMADFLRSLVLAVIALLPWGVLTGAVALPLYLRRRARRNLARTTPPLPPPVVGGRRDDDTIPRRG